jgi:hypothetical protein
MARRSLAHIILVVVVAATLIVGKPEAFGGSLMPPNK